MKKINLFLIYVFLSVTAFSQTPQWRDLPNSPFFSTRMEDVFFLNESTGWSILNNVGKVFRTTNGGNNWDTLFTLVGGSFRSIGFFDSQNGLLGTLSDDSNLVLFRTTNGGTNFTALTTLSSPRIMGTCGINILNDSTAYACGRWDTPARIIKTTDKGISWSSFIIDTLMAKSIVDCYFFNADSGIAVGGTNALAGDGNAVVLRTVNGGITWTRVHRTTRTRELCWKVSFVNNNLGYASIQGSSYYLKTTDGGVSWEEKLFRAYTQQGIGFINESTGWIGGWSGATYETTDSGNSWHLSGWGRNINRFRFINDTIAYSVGQRVYKYSTISVGINITSSAIPAVFSLFQNYPNPFNPTTKIKFDIPNSLNGELSNVKLIIFDVLGKEVQILVNENLAPGSYETEFDGSSFSSGIYFYKLEMQNFIETKRMILVK